MTKCEIYDQLLRPALNNLFAVCDEHGIDFLTCFDLDSGPRYSYHLSPGGSEVMMLASSLLIDPELTLIAFEGDEDA